MPGNVTHRLRSEQGASMSMALMLFLVCTTVASIVITAASASAGRLSQLRETDKSYYNVTSAAGLIWDELGASGKTVTIVRSCTAQKNEDDEWIDPSDWKCEIDGVQVSSDGVCVPVFSLFQVATSDVLFENVRPSANDEETLSLASPRYISDADIAGAISFPSEWPEPVDFWESNGIAYQFVLTVPNCNPVLVTMRGIESDVFSFTFEEQDENGNGISNSTVCTLVANASSVTDRYNELGNRLSWTTTVTWNRDYMTTGGAI